MSEICADENISPKMADVFFIAVVQLWQKPLFDLMFSCSLPWPGAEEVKIDAMIAPLMSTP